MVTWKSLKPAQRNAAGQVFDALSTFDTLTGREDAERAARDIGFPDIYAFATDPLREMDNTLREALLRNPRLRRDLDRMLANRPVYRFRRVAAASSGQVDGREGDGFSLRLRVSRADPRHTFVTIELAPGTDKAPSMLFVCRDGEDYIKHALPVPQDGIIQLLVETDSDLVNALRDIQTEVFIR